MDYDRKLREVTEQRHGIIERMDALDMSKAEDEEAFDRLVAEDNRLQARAAMLVDLRDTGAKATATAERIIEENARDERDTGKASWLSTAAAFAKREKLPAGGERWLSERDNGQALVVPWHWGVGEERGRAVFGDGTFESRQRMHARALESDDSVIGELPARVINDRLQHVTGVKAGAAMVIMTATSQDLPAPTANDTSNDGALVAEGTAISTSSVDPSTASNDLKAYEYHSGFIRASRKFLRDLVQQDPIAWIASIAMTRIAKKTNAAFTNGTGSNQPQGFITGATSAKTTASNSAITAEELLDLFHSVDPEYALKESAEWQMNWSTVAAVKKLARVSGDNVHGVAISYMAGAMGAPDRLEGHRVIVNQAMSNIAAGATNKPVSFGDMSQYIVREVADKVMLRLVERFAEHRETGFLWIEECDGRLLQSTAVKFLTMKA